MSFAARVYDGYIFALTVRGSLHTTQRKKIAPLPTAVACMPGYLEKTGDVQSGPLPPYGTLLTDTSGARSYVWSKVIGVYQTVAQKGRARGEKPVGRAVACL